MLAIRLQRRGRKGHAQFRIIVQESRLSPSSGRVVAYLGAYDPHTKETTLDTEQASKYLTNGAQPSPRVIKILKQEKVTLPKWVQDAPKKDKSIRNPEKLRKNQPAEEEAPKEEAPAEPEAAEEEKPAEKAETEKSDDSEKTEESDDKKAE